MFVGRLELGKATKQRLEPGFYVNRPTIINEPKSLHLHTNVTHDMQNSSQFQVLVGYRIWQMSDCHGLLERS